MNDVSDSLFFSDALAQVAQQLHAAQSEVVCAIAGACGRPLFELLLGCRRRGLALTVLVPENAQDAAPGIAWERLDAAGAALHCLSPGAPGLLTSVCVIDSTHVLSGALAELGAASDPQTAGVLLQTDGALAMRCLQHLANLVLSCADHPSAAGATQARAAPLADAGSELVVLEQTAHACTDWQSELLEAHTLAMHAEIAEMHRTLNAFDREQDASIGDLLRQCMDAKRLHLQRMYARTQAQEAQERFDQYTQAQDAKPAPPTALDPQAQTQMKQLYRKLAMRLHPDRVDASDKPEAQALFQHLQTSYENNDFLALQRLQQQVLQAAGGSPGGLVAAPPARNSAGRAIALQARLTQQQRERSSILRSATWQTLSTQRNWAVWFAQQAQYLLAELERYDKAVSCVQPKPPAEHTL